MNLFLSIWPLSLIFVTFRIDKNLYMCVFYFDPSSEVKLWFNSFIQWARSSLNFILPVYNSFQALSKQLTGTEFISCFSVQVNFLLISSTGTQSKLWPIKIRAFHFRFFWMNDDLYYCWIHYRLFVTDSDLVSGFWIGCARSKQENTIRRSKPVSTVFSSAPDIGRVLWAGKWVWRCRDNSKTLSTPSEEDQARLKKLSSSKSTTQAVVE